MRKHARMHTARRSRLDQYTRCTRCPNAQRSLSRSLFPTHACRSRGHPFRLESVQEHYSRFRIASFTAAAAARFNRNNYLMMKSALFTLFGSVLFFFPGKQKMNVQSIMTNCVNLCSSVGMAFARMQLSRAETWVFFIYSVNQARPIRKANAVSLVRKRFPTCKLSRSIGKGNCTSWQRKHRRV